MNKLKEFSNQELLTELDQRLANFTPEELKKLIILIVNKEPKATRELLQAEYPLAYQWCQEQIQAENQKKINPAVRRKNKRNISQEEIALWLNNSKSKLKKN